MEERLAAYRAKKVKEEKAKKSWLNRMKGYFRQEPIIEEDKNTLSPAQVGTENTLQDAGVGHLNVSNNELRVRGRDLRAGTRNESLENEPRNIEDMENHLKLNQAKSESRKNTEKWWMFFLFLKFLLWLCVWGIFIELEFGAVYFAFSVLIFIYFNTRTGQKDNKPSAYSVFNKDFEQIQGTVTAEQLQKNMFRIPGVSA